MLSKQELSILFINWKDLIITNTKLMKSMRIRRSTVQSQSMIGDILCENVRPYHPKSSQLSVKIFVAVPSDDCLHSFLFLPALGSSTSSKAGISRELNILRGNLPFILLTGQVETRHEFDLLLRQCQAHQRVQGMPLSFYLLKPVKRVCEHNTLISDPKKPQF